MRIGELLGDGTHTPARVPELYPPERDRVRFRLLAAHRPLVRELLGGLERNTNSGVPATVAGTSPYAQALSEAGLGERTAQYWQEAARFEDKLESYVESCREGLDTPTWRGSAVSSSGVGIIVSPRPRRITLPLPSKRLRDALRAREAAYTDGIHLRLPDFHNLTPA